MDSADENKGKSRFAEATFDAILREAPVSLADLNEFFYRTYPRQYFVHSLNLTLSGLSDPKSACSPLSEGQSLRDGDSNPILRVQLELEDDELDSFKDSMRMHLRNLTSHAWETLLRLFLAHRPGVSFPWVELASEDDFRRFRKKLGDMLEYSDEWTGHHDEDEAFRLAFAPQEKPEPETVTRLTAAKRWVAFAAKEVLDSGSYNSYKHGLSASLGEETFGVYGREDDPRENPDASPIVEAKGQVVIHLQKKRKPDGSEELFREARFVRLSECASFVWVAQRYIETILDVGAWRFLSQKPEELLLPAYDPSDLLSAARRDSPVLDQFSFGLGLTRRPKRSPRKKKRKKK